MNRCEKCIYKKMCKKWAEIYVSRTGNIVGFNGCEHFTEADKIITLPCKVGDMVWHIKSLRDGTGKETRAVSDGERVKQISINNHGMFLVVDYCQMLDCEDFGKTVFLTREEAEKALKEREQE